MPKARLAPENEEESDENAKELAHKIIVEKNVENLRSTKIENR